MAKKKKASKVKVAPMSSEEMKQNIIRCAKQEFAQHGFQGANLKDVAKCAGTAGSLINYHFKDKAGLFKSCTEVFARTRMGTITRILDAEPNSYEEFKTRIELFVEEMITSYMEDPNGFNIIRNEVRAENPVALEIFEATFLHSFNHVCAFFEKAQKNGLVDKKLEVIIISKMLFQMTCESAQNDHLGKKYFNMTIHQEEWRKKLAVHIVHVFMNGVTV